MEELLEFMYRIGCVLNDEDFSLDEPLCTLCYMQDWYEEAVDGIISMDGFKQAFEEFMMNKTGITEYRQ